jgi:hypothetical protein
MNAGSLAIAMISLRTRSVIAFGVPAGASIPKNARV